MRKFKVVKTNHPLSALTKQEAYAIVTIAPIFANDPIKGVYCADEDDMHVIAEDFNEAAELLNQWIYL